MGIFDRIFKRPIKSQGESLPDSYSTVDERRDKRLEDRQTVVENSFARDQEQNPTKAKRATVRGKSYIYWAPRIEELKREGRLEEALDLALECCGAAERDRQSREPAPAYTRHAAIICRKLGYLVDEIRILERWLSFGVESKSRAFEERIPKAQKLIEVRLGKGISIDEMTRPPKVIRGKFN